MNCSKFIEFSKIAVFAVLCWFYICFHVLYFTMQELELAKDEKRFYSNAEDYWENVPATVEGMLGGFGCVSYADIQGSEAFLKKLFQMKEMPGHKRALDCGAGIGRITKNLLTKYFDRVDLVEQNPKFLETAKTMLSLEPNVGDFYTVGLQNFIPEDSYYDCIWCQWVLSHLTNNHLVHFLNNCRKGLRKNGMIIVKENIANDIVEDKKDSSVTRPNNMFLKLFEHAGLKVTKQCKQTNFPKELFQVKIFALQPIENATRHT